MPGAVDQTALATLSETSRTEAHRRWLVLRPHLEDGVPLTRVAGQYGVSHRTLQRWLAPPPSCGRSGMNIEHDLVRLLGEARDYGRNLANDVRGPDLALQLARDLALTLDHARSQALILDRSHPLDRPLALALDRGHSRAHDLADMLTIADDLVRQDAHAFDGVPHRRARTARANNTIRNLTRDIDRALAGARKFAGRTAPAHVAPAAGRLAAAATRLLPTADRPRYGGEFRSELWELAEAGAGRRQQLLCALRQFRCAVPLRFAVHATRTRKASP
jgi:hypothetical protein